MESSKNTATYTETYQTKDTEDLRNNDIGLKIFTNVEDVAGDIDPVEERRLVRKIDMMVIPFICVTYLVTYLDKAVLGYAAVFGLQTDLKLHGTQYSWLGSIFYFGYLMVCSQHTMNSRTCAELCSLNIQQALRCKKFRCPNGLLGTSSSGVESPWLLVAALRSLHLQHFALSLALWNPVPLQHTS